MEKEQEQNDLAERNGTIFKSWNVPSPIFSNKRQNGFTDWAQILCETSHHPREGLWNMDAQNHKLHPKVCDFCEILKICDKIIENREFFFVIVLYCAKRKSSQKESQLKGKIEDGREEP